MQLTNAKLYFGLQIDLDGLGQSGLSKRKEHYFKLTSSKWTELPDTIGECEYMCV